MPNNLTQKDLMASIKFEVERFNIGLELNPSFAKTQLDILNLANYYYMSKYRDGDTDSLGQHKVFYNISVLPVEVAAKSLDIDTQCLGYPNRTMFMFPSGAHKSLFWQECLQKGVFFGWANFISYSHREREILYTLNVIRQSLQVVKENWLHPLRVLKGAPAREVFRLVTEKK